MTKVFKSLILLCIFNLLPMYNSQAQVPQLLWGVKYGGSSQDRDQEMEVDEDGFVYTTGRYGGTADFDPGSSTKNFTSKGSRDIYVAKLTPDGKHAWAFSVGGGSDDQSNGLKLDNQSNVYICGRFGGSNVDFDPGSGTAYLSSKGSDDVFIAKYDSSGKYLWAKSIGTNGVEQSFSLALNDKGDVIVIGRFNKKCDFDPGLANYNLTPNGYDIFMLSLDKNGDFNWAKQLGGNGSGFGRGIEFDVNGHLVVGGMFSGTIDVDPGTGTKNLTSSSGYDFFIAKYDSLGKYIWAQQFVQNGGVYGEGVKGIVLDSAGRIYCTGQFTKQTDFDPGPGTLNYSPTGGSDGFILKLDSSGKFIWAKQLKSTGTGIFQGIDINDGLNENIVVSGWFKGDIDADPDTGTVTFKNQGDYDVLVDILDSAGNYVTAFHFGASHFEHGTDPTFSHDGRYLHVNGSFERTIDFDPSPQTFNMSASGDEDAFVIKINWVPTDSFDLGPDTLFCGDSFLLDTKLPKYKHQWSNDSTSSQIWVTKTGEYSVAIETPLITLRDTIRIEIHPNPEYSLPSDTVFCSKDSLELNTGLSDLVYHHQWNTSIQDTLSKIIVDTSSQYIVSVETEYGCIISDTINVEVNPTPFFELGKDTTFCSIDSLILRVSDNSGYTYQWNTNATDTSIVVKNTGRYHLEIETDKGCIWEDSIEVTVNPTPFFELGKDTSICQGDSIILSTGFDMSYDHLWNNNTTQNQRKIQENGLFKVQVTTSENCSFTDSIRVGYLTMPQYDLGNDTSICLGDTLEVATGLDPFFYTFKWNVGSSKSSVKISQTDTLEVRVTNIFKCNKYDTLIVSIDSLPIFNLPNDTMICENDSIQIQSNLNPSFHSFSWEHGPGLHEVWVSNSGGYVLNVTDTNACSFKDTFTLKTKVLPSFDLGPDSAYCKGDTIDLNTGYNALNYSFYWNTTDTKPSLKVAGMGDYNVRVIDTLGCVYSDTVSIFFDTIPTFNLGPDLEYCAGDSVWVNSGYVTTDYTYLWSHNATTPSVYIKNPGSYHLTVTSPAFCTFRDTVIISENPNPVFSFGPDLMGCEGDTFTLLSGLSNTGYIYQWNTSESTNNIKVFTDGDYDLQVTTPKNCIWRDTVNVEINELPTFTLPDEIEACDGETVTLDVNSSFAGPLTYVWSSGEDTKSITKSISGVYHVTAETNNNCSYSDTTEIVIHPNPIVDLGADTAICGVFTIDKGVVNNPNHIYLWNNLETVSMRSINSYGLHILAVENEFGCSTIDSILIEELQLPFIPLPSKIVLTCKEETFLVQVAEEEVDYLWSTGDQTSQIVVKDTGLYTLTYSLSNCSITDSILVSRVCPTDYPLLIPTAFTPNAGGKDGDNLNNTFRPHIPVSNGPLKKYNMQVFNRWGELLFETDDPTKGWDGKVRGKTCPNGVYMYLFTYQFEYFIEETQSGTVHILR